MAEGFGASPEALLSTAEAIGDATSGVGTSGLSGLLAEAVGHDGLATSLANFADEWGRGVRQMAGDGRRFAHSLDRVAGSYREQDEAVARSLSGSTD